MCAPRPNPESIRFALPRVVPFFVRRRHLDPFSGHAVLLGMALLAFAFAGIRASDAATLESRIAASTDDAEEAATGTMYVNSSDLELVYDGSNQVVGMRWPALAIPKGSTITTAYIQFSAKEAQSEVTSLTLRGQAADNPAAFTSGSGNLSTRPRTTAAASWAPVAWTVGQAGANQRTPELKSVIQEIVTRPGWASGNALAIIVTGTGHRTAWAWDGTATAAPLLHVEYGPSDLPPVASLVLTQPPTPALTVNANASGSTDTDATPIASYRFDFGDGSPVVTTTAPTATTQHAYAAAGTYTVTLTVIDTGGNTSAPVTSAIAIRPELPPVASLAVTQPATPALTVSASGSGSADTDLTPIASYRFDFGDGSPVVTTTAPTAIAQHTYAVAGPYTVTLIVTDTANNTSTPVSSAITVRPELPPVAALSVTQLAAPALTVMADASGSTDTDLTPIASYRFDFGDGSPVVTTTAPTTIAQHTYAAAGPYTVTLTVTDTGNNGSSPVTSSVTVDPPPDSPPVASLSVTQPATPALTVKADASGSTDIDATPIASYQFDFGDGSPIVTTTAPTAIAQHTYAAAGLQTVTLTVTDSGDHTSTPVSANITVQPDSPPVASLSVTQPATPELTVNVSGSGSTDTDLTPIASYRFDFGDGSPVVTTTAPTATSQHTYAAAGPYTVTLIVTDTGSNTSAPVSSSITVQPESPPLASLSVTQLATPALTVSASGSGSTDADLTPIASYRFNFGDGSPVVTTIVPTATAQHTYVTAGTYTVTLTVTDTGNNTSAPASSAIIVNAPLTSADEIHWTITGQTSVTFDWRGPQSTIRYGLTAAYGQTATAVTPNPLPYSSTGPFWEARITGLTENTTYHYSIGNSADHTFHTPPPRGSSGFMIMAEADIGDVSVYPLVAGVQADIAALQPAFTLCVGDLTYGNDNGQSVVDKHFNDVMVWSRDAAYMPAWGNHEWDKATDDMRNYKGRFDLPNTRYSPNAPAPGAIGEDWYWFDYGNVRFIAYPEPYSGAWADWAPRASALMDSAQADPAIRFIVTFGHRPAYSSGHHPGDAGLKGYLDGMGATHSKYVLNLNGHSHDYERSYPQSGVTHVTFGTGGSSLEEDVRGGCAWLGGCPAPAWSAFRAYHRGALKLRFSANGIQGEEICGPANPTGSNPDDVSCTEGSVLDAFTIGTLNTPPVAALTVTPASGLAPLTVTADASGSHDPDGSIASYQFDFGDGSAVVTTTPPTATVQHVYTTARSYTVTLTVTDNGGGTSTPVTSSVTATSPVELPPSASLVLSQLATPALTVKADASGSTDTDVTPIASYQFNFGDGSPVVTTTAPTATAQHTYAAAGPYTVTLIVTDTGNNTSTLLSGGITVNPPSAPTIVERRIAASTDDAEESATGSMYVNSSDLELVYDGNNQVVGMRWTGLAIPKGSTITTAYVQFGAKEAQSEVTSLTLRGQAADNPATFASGSGNLSTRPRTTAAASWAPVAWTVGQAGANQRTPELKSVIQEIVTRPGWASGNALAIIVTGTGHRTAYAWDGSATAAPLLHVEYGSGAAADAAPVPVLSVTQALSPALTVTANASGSTDTDATPIASYQFNFGDGTPLVTTTAPTATAQHTYAAAGTYTVTLTVTDTGSNTSAPVSSAITVNPPATGQIAVYGGYYDTHHLVNPKPKPDPWSGSSNVVFIGQPDNQPGDPVGGGWDTSTLRIDNLTSGTLTGVVVSVDIGSNHFALWGTSTIPAGSRLILAQTAFQNFDGSDLNPAGCYGCDTTLCTTMIQSTVPMVHVTINGTTTDYADTGQLLNTHGVDAAGCPYVGGPLPETRYDESEAWAPIGPAAAASSLAASSRIEAIGQPTIGTPPRLLSLATPGPNPSRGDFTVRFTTPQRGPVRVRMYDLSGRVVHRFVDNVLDAGSYSFHADIDDLSPGMYFIHLWTPLATRQEKIAITR